MASKPLKVALCQFFATANKSGNIEKASKYITQAAERGNQLIILPEMFNTPYDNKFFRDYSEKLDGDQKESPTVHFLKKIAKELKIWLIGGSICERDSEDKIYNTSLVFSPEGELAAKHRKLYLFDIDAPGMYFKESETLTAGNSITIFDALGVRFGLGICYDIRFPEYSRMLGKKGAEVLVFPAAFNPTTGPLHFELLAKARAVDNQCYVLMAAPARNLEDKEGYQSWGHSMVVNANALVVAQAELEETLVEYRLDFDTVEDQRRHFPYKEQRRDDILELVEKSK